MGSVGSDITQDEFNKSWKPSATVQKLQNLTIWENRDNPSHKLEQYQVPDYDEPTTKQLYQLRRNSSYLVNAYSLKKNGLTICETSHETTKLFVEKIPLRLSNLKDIPYPDVLHLYDSCLNGFQQLASVVGFFPVDEDFIGVNDQGQVKVWLNTAFEVSTVLGSRGISQADMVEELLQLLHNATDQTSFPSHAPNLSDYIGVVNSETTFELVKQRFFSYIKQYNKSQVPLTLQCLEEAGGADQVKNWCKNNSSFGFQQGNMRLAERAYQQKLNRKLRTQIRQIQGTASVPQYESVYYNANQQCRQTIASAGPQPQLVYKEHQPQIINQPIEEVRQVNAQVPFNQASVFYTLSNPPNQIPVNSTPTFPSSKRIIQNPLPPVGAPTSSQARPFVNQVQQQPTIITPINPNQPQFIPNSASVTFSNSKLSVQSRKVPFSPQQLSGLRYDSNLIPQAENRHQRVNSQAIQIKKGSQVINNASYVANQPPVVTAESTVFSTSNIQALSNVERKAEPSNERNYSYEPNFSKSKLLTTDPSSDDGKPSSDFLATFSTLKNPKTKFEITEVYSHVEETPKSYLKEESSSSSRKNINQPHETTYSRDYFLTYAKDSKKHIISTVSNNFPNALDNEPEADAGEKYSGQYKFPKYDRTIDPELLADLQRYK